VKQNILLLLENNVCSYDFTVKVTKKLEPIDVFIPFFPKLYLIAFLLQRFKHTTVLKNKVYKSLYNTFIK